MLGFCCLDGPTRLIGDPRETPGRTLAEALMEKGIKVSAWDPHLDGGFSDGVEVISDIDKASGRIAILVTARKHVLT